MTAPRDRFPTGSLTGSFSAPSQHRFPVPHPYGDRNRCDRFPRRFPEPVPHGERTRP